MDQLIVFGTLVGALVLFSTSFVRYDVVALVSLMVLAVTGIVPASEAFVGFGNPAVITVAAVLVISRALENAGLVTIISAWVSRVGSNPTLQVAALTGLVTVLSAFINNVGALALMMPVAIHLSRKYERSPSYLLMPMAFGTLLGGMTTLIGTPPNLIISEFRRDVSGEPFGMFDFTWAGAGVAIAGVLFISTAGWRLVPRRRGKSSRRTLFQIEKYLSEVQITEASDLIGQSIRQLAGNGGDVIIAGLVREGERVGRLSNFVPLRAGDELIVVADSEALTLYMEKHKLAMTAIHPTEEQLGTDESSLIEAVVTRYSPAEYKTARKLRLRQRYGANLIGLARHGEALQQRLADAEFQSGDVLLLQMPFEDRSETLARLGLLPLAERELKIGRPRRLVVAMSIFVAALLTSAFGWLPTTISFTVAVILLLQFNTITLREAYDSIDWSIIILLGAMIPVGQALETTGGAAQIAEWMLSFGGGFPPAVMLAVLMVVTMCLTDVINNAAAAIVMAPVSTGIATAMNASADPFLLAIAIGASCAFLTPIGHQCNTLVMGPGGYSFGDYWKPGIFVELIVAVVAIPLLLLFWPLY